MRHGDTSGRNGPARDETERPDRRREREARLERRVERLESVIQSVEHDIRGALVVGSGHLDAARLDPDADHFDGVEHAHDRIETLLGDLRATAAVGETDRDRRPVDVATTAREAWAGIETAGATLTVQAAPTVVANHDRLLRLLENLLRNAVQHGTTDHGPSDRPATPAPDRDDGTATAGETVRSRRRDGALELLAPDAGGESVPRGTDGGSRDALAVTVGSLERRGFFVADDGRGIPAGDADRIFEPGYTTTTSGTGLGLAVVGEVADEHGWTVRATDSESGGARFEVADVDTLAGAEPTG